MNARLGTRFAPIKAVSRPRDAIHPKTIHQTHGDTMKNHFTPFASDANAKTVSASLSHPSTARNLLKSPVRGIVQILLFLLAVHMLTGCATAQLVSNDSTFSISSLENALQQEGIFVMPRGPANLDIPADQSSRLILNSSEVLTVFHFQSEEQAHRQARAFAGANPRHDVYIRDSLVAVRQTSGNTGLSGTLRLILGEAL